jgi:hypothetical protein
MSGAMFELAAAVIGEAIRGLVKTIAGMLLLAIVLAGISFWISFEGSWQRGLFAVAVVLSETGIIGAILSAKRAVLSGLEGGLRNQRLGQRAASLLLSGDGPLGRAAGTIPLAEAERRLRLAVDSTLGGLAESQSLRAMLARSIQERLIRLIEQVTLTRFRFDAAEHGGGVDMEKVCTEIGQRADELMLAKVSGIANKLTALLVLAATALALLAAFALRQWEP